MPLVPDRGLTPLRIGLFTDTYSPQVNGVVTSVRSLATALRELGHDVTVVAPRHPHQRPEQGVVRLRSTVYRPQPEQRMALPPSPRKLLELQRLGLDLVHTHGAVTLPVIGLSVARAFGLPLVHTYHTRMRDYLHYYPWYGSIFWLSDTRRWFMRSRRVSARLRLGLDRGTVRLGERFDVWYANRCMEVLAPAEPIADELRRMGVRRPVRVVPSGIDLEALRSPRPDPFPALGLKPGAPRLLTVSRVAREKGLDALLDRFARVLKARPDARLAVVGDGPERPDFERLARELGVADAVVWVGYVSPADVAAYYQHADVFVFASVSETQGLVGLEAAACGLPIVARGRMGITKCVLDGRTGYLVEPDDGPAFAHRTLELLADPARRKSFSAAANAWASAEGSHRRMAERVLRSYERAIRGFEGWDFPVLPPPRDPAGPRS